MRVCPRCSDNFIVNQKFLKCYNCQKRYHYACSGLKDVQCKFITDCKSVVWLCDGCANKPSRNSASVPDISVEKLECEVAVLNKEIDCLNREKQLLNKLLIEMDTMVDLFKSKINGLEQNSLADKNLKNADINDRTKKGISYSEALSSKINNDESAVLLVKINKPSISKEDIFKDVTSKIKPAELKVCVNDTREIKNGIAVFCENSDGLNTLKKELTKKLSSDISSMNQRDIIHAC